MRLFRQIFFCIQNRIFDSFHDTHLKPHLPRSKNVAFIHLLVAMGSLVGYRPSPSVIHARRARPHCAKNPGDHAKKKPFRVERAILIRRCVVAFESALTSPAVLLNGESRDISQSNSVSVAGVSTHAASSGSTIFFSFPFFSVLSSSKNKMG